MSSYLNFYLVPKKKGEAQKPEPMLFQSHCRSSNIYQTFYEEIHPVYIGNGDEYQYSELTADDVLHCINRAKRELEITEKGLNNKVDAYKAIMGPNIEPSNLDDIIDSYICTKEYIEELKENIVDLQGIYDWVDGIKYTDFEKVLINID